MPRLPTTARWLAGLLLMPGARGTTGTKDVPAPPAQHQAWKAPQSSLPANVVSAAEALFRQGLPDPRGCEYREIDIAGPTVIKTHGWVLPGKGKPRYAIGWNGLIYPVAGVGEKVDPAKQFADFAPENQRFRGNGNGWPMNDTGSLLTSSALPIKVALLLRAGEVPVAVQVWTEGNAGRDAKQIPDPYVEMAALWLGRWFNQAIDAYLKGDDATALAICRQLAPALQQTEATAQARGLAKEWAKAADEENLWQVATLQAEAARRLAEPATSSILQTGQPAAGPERIVALIRALETVSVHQLTNPGETNVAEDPGVDLLVQEGEPAIKPLLRCLREDDRLTRSRYTEGMSRSGPIIPVYEAAYKALFRILRTSFSVPSEGENPPRDSLKNPRRLDAADREALAEQIEGVWKKKIGTTPPGLGYVTLQDDKAGPEAWFQAVGDIVQPSNGTFTAYRLGPHPTGTYTLYRGPQGFPMKGDALRDKTAPSVSELMLKRFWELEKEAPGPAVSWHSLAYLYLSFADWDGPAHLADLRAMCHALAACFPTVPPSFGFQPALPSALFERRAALGDPTALADYAAWLQELAPGSFERGANPTACLRLMWEQPEDPAIAQAASKLFADPASPWLPLTYRNGHQLSRLISTPLLGLPAFRQGLEHGLADRTVAGEAIIKQNHHVDVELTDCPGEDSYRDSSEDPLAPPADSRVGFRLCDYYAWQLSLVDGFPRCELYWPEAHRDEAVAASRIFLQRYGNNFRYEKQDAPEAFLTEPPKASLHFPHLDHPATPEDVAQGHAIFALSGSTRLCARQAFPTALRPSRSEDPKAETTRSKTGRPEPLVFHTTAGRVCQAEETWVDGKWQRYYGFVGRYQCEQAPAAEIEFIGLAAGIALTPALKATVEGPAQKSFRGLWGSYAINSFASAATPLPVTITLFNQSGLDQPVPAGLALPPKAGRALPRGLRLDLSYSKKSMPYIVRSSSSPPDYGPWRDVPLRPDRPTTPPADHPPTLSPAESLPLLTFDLRDHFDLTRPGTYRLKATFQLSGRPPVSTEEILIPVEVAAK